ncbi:hypothetical protein [Micromonospora sp. NPDC050495]|uniref:hypothetical protein n=1 Tax=Micromonospora sp. NPDC050495 TaxID=3154936 RepID=UPI0033FBB966
MTDHDVLRVVSEGLSGLDMEKPAEEIIATGNARRRRRSTAVAVVGAALAAGLVVGVPALTGRGPAGPSVAERPATSVPVSMAPVAFSVVGNPNGTVTLKLSSEQLADPDEVREALAGAGVPAEVRVGSLCYSLPAPPGTDQVFSSSGNAVLVITPSAIPKGAVVSIGYKGGDGPMAFGMAWKNRMTCYKL